jgi:hypothetical protein
LKRILWFVLFLFVNVESFSQSSLPLLGPIVPDRPGQTNPPDVIPSRIVQLETGFLRETSTSDGIRTLNFLYSTSLVRIGVFETCELRLVLEYAGTKIDSALHTAALDGFNPVSVGTKLAV